MKTVHKSVLIWFSAEEMFDLVAAVDRYPEFLPWCDRAAILETHADGVTAEVGIALGGIRQSFTTRNTHRRPRDIAMKLVKGPFSSLDGLWTFSPVGDAASGAKAGQSAERACRIEFSLSYDFSNVALAALVGPVFEKIASSFVDAFVKRAEKVYD